MRYFVELSQGYQSAIMGKLYPVNHRGKIYAEEGRILDRSTWEEQTGYTLDIEEE